MGDTEGCNEEAEGLKATKLTTPVFSQLGRRRRYD
jgi:hypothetical protein